MKRSLESDINSFIIKFKAKKPNLHDDMKAFLKRMEKKILHKKEDPFGEEDWDD